MKVPTDPTPQTPADWQARIYEAVQLFSPGAPIDEADLFAGRPTQISRIIDTVLQRGLHAILYGERGVGKSSLANTFATRVVGKPRTVTCISINCHQGDDFTAVWRKVFRRLEVGGENLSQRYPDKITPDDVIVELSNFSANSIPIIILDEFDSLKNRPLQNAIANTIKNLSDASSITTVIVVGVANSVGDLIDEHESIERCLRQIQMPRMDSDEMKEIIEKRLPRLGMKIRPDALAFIVGLSRGLPHYAHLFGQQSAKKALEAHTLTIDIAHVEKALPACISETAQTIREKYHKATISPRAGNIYKEVLLAAALTQVDELGYFQPVGLRRTLAELMHRDDAPVSLYGQHLKVLCEDDRGNILEQTGASRKYRYRFPEPMMQPFILMLGLATKAV
ncbi:MAG TPA: AAA family ATPase, partial [Xanthobacteraceae bacterium]|nr:AAA family ATPase [Xanthobacteraceae bacterium]